MNVEPALIPEHAHRALLLIEKLAAVGAHPTVDHVEVLAASEGPRAAVYDNPLISMSAAMKFAHLRNKVSDAEPVVRWLERLGWVCVDGKHVALTAYGTTFLAALRARPDAQPARDTGAVLLLDPENPFVYQEMTGQVAKAGAGMLVDPYFKGDGLDWVLNATSLTRVLVSSKGPQAKEVEQVALALYGLRENPAAARLEVRSTASTELHDRVVLAEDSSVLLLGTSLTGVGRHLSTIVALGPVPGGAVRKYVEKLWAKADVVEARGITRAGQ